MTTSLQTHTDVTDQTLTQNGALTHATSLNANVDLFFTAGASRNLSDAEITTMFSAAYKENSEAATRIMQWARDVRGGAGERKAFRVMFKALIAHDTAIARRVLVNIPTLGRWDDVFTTFGTALERDGLRMITNALHANDGLCAKWMPRKGPNANKIRAYLRLTPKQYRKMVVNMTNVVEQSMCAKEWDKIAYGQVPSVASARYQRAFGRNDTDRYVDYINGLQKGTEKINAGAVYPYDIVRSLKSGNEKVSNAQWKALPDFIQGSTDNILPVVDVSGSMWQTASGSISALDVAVSLGMYISERNAGHFKDSFVTFSQKPVVVSATGTLSERYKTMSTADWGFNTNLHSVFNLVLSSAKMHKLTSKEMPSTIVVLSDMEFDSAVKGDTSATAFDHIRTQYELHGYEMPKIVFWNLCGQVGNVPVRFNETGTALVSGFSPSIMKSLLANVSDMSKFTPESTMIETIIDPRYDF